MNIYIRTDSALNIGSGHVMRCLNLADGISVNDPNSEVTFICKNHKGNLKELIHRRGHKIELMDNKYEPTLDIKTWLGGEWEEDAKGTIKIIKDNEKSKKSGRYKKVCWLIIDHYNIYKKWEELVCENISNLRILVVDDYFDREHMANIVVNQMYRKDNESVMKKYLKLVTVPYPDRNLKSNRSTFLLGTEYCLLNQEIIKYRKCSKKIKIEKVMKVLLTLGGNDPENVTLEIIKSLNDNQEKLEVEIIIGKSNPHHLEISNYLQTYKSKSIKFNLYQGINQEEVFKILLKCDFAIGAIGVSMYERLCIGLPSMVISIAENQVSICEAMNDLVVDLGFGLNFNKDLLGKTITDWVNNGNRLENKRRRYQDLCDGKGVFRIIDRICAINDVLPALKYGVSYPLENYLFSK